MLPCVYICRDFSFHDIYINWTTRFLAYPLDIFIQDSECTHLLSRLSSCGLYSASIMKAAPSNFLLHTWSKFLTIIFCLEDTKVAWTSHNTRASYISPALGDWPPDTSLGLVLVLLPFMDPFRMTFKPATYVTLSLRCLVSFQRGISTWFHKAGTPWILRCQLPETCGGRKKFSHDLCIGGLVLWRR